VIADSELPDLVYLEEKKESEFYERLDAAAGDSARSTIVIEDLDDFGVIELPRVPPASTRASGPPHRRAQGRGPAGDCWGGLGFVFVLVLVIAVFASACSTFAPWRCRAPFTDQAASTNVQASRAMPCCWWTPTPSR
jgi:hypothetical protein